MKTSLKSILALILTFALVTIIGLPVFADAEPTAEAEAVAVAETAESAEASVSSAKAWAAGIAIALAAAAGAIAMGMTISKSSESISRQPEATGAIRTSMMLGLVFIETAIIYALIIAILIIFVL